MTNENKIYLELIIKKYNWLCDNDDDFNLRMLNETSVKNELIKHINSIKEIQDFDRVIFKNYIETQSEERLLEEFKKKEESFSKNICRLLSGTTKYPQKTGLLDICAFLVDIKPRPFQRNYDYNKVKVEKKIKFSKSKKVKLKLKHISTLGLVGFLIITIISLCIIYTLSNKENNSSENTEPHSSVTINTENFTVSDINRIIPNRNTTFFDKNNQPQIWYASDNNQLDFYNTSGKHPITNEQLQPITKKIIKTIFLEKEKITPKKITAKSERYIENTKIIKENSLFNTSIVNTKNNKEISLFIFDSINRIDQAFSNHLKQELIFKKYKVTPSLIFPDQLTLEVTNHLKSGDFKYFNDEIEKYTDYVCIGYVLYSFPKNTIREDMITCQIQVNYSIRSLKTGEIIDSFSKLNYGNGFSKFEAKNNTIKKFKL